MTDMEASRLKYQGPVCNKVQRSDIRGGALPHLFSLVEGYSIDEL